MLFSKINLCHIPAFLCSWLSPTRYHLPQFFHSLFIIFFFIGIASLSKANKMVAMVSQEEEVNDDILTWIEENITDEWIATLMNEEETEENNYFLVHKTMCDKVEQQYPLINKDYIDQLMDERYNDYCEENK